MVVLIRFNGCLPTVDNLLEHFNLSCRYLQLNNVLLNVSRRHVRDFGLTDKEVTWMSLESVILNWVRQQLVRGEWNTSSSDQGQKI